MRGSGWGRRMVVVLGIGARWSGNGIWEGYGEGVGLGVAWVENMWVLGWAGVVSMVVMRRRWGWMRDGESHEFVYQGRGSGRDSSYRMWTWCS